MIIAKDYGGTIRYLLPLRTDVPSLIQYSVYSPDGTLLAGPTSATVPVKFTLSSPTPGADEGLVVGTLPTGKTWEGDVGYLARVIDASGALSDCICSAKSGRSVTFADVGISASTLASCYSPVVSLAISSGYLLAYGDGYRVSVSLTYTGGVIISDTVPFAVAPYPSLLAISPREFLAYHPELAHQTMELQRRTDWPLLIERACEMVEQELYNMDLWYSSVISTTTHKRAVAAALNLRLAPATTPTSQAYDPASWMQSARSAFKQAIESLIQNATHDAAGSASTAEQLPRRGYLVRRL